MSHYNCNNPEHLGGTCCDCDKKKESKNIFLMESKFMGAVAGSAVRQSPYHRPDNLEVVLDKLHELVKPTFEKATMGVAELTDEQLEELVKQLRNIPEYEAWNERKNGNKAPYSFTTRYSSPDPDNDFIDSDALRWYLGQAKEPLSV